MRVRACVYVAGGGREGCALRRPSSQSRADMSFIFTTTDSAWENRRNYTGISIPGQVSNRSGESDVGLLPSFLLSFLSSPAPNRVSSGVTEFRPRP